ncbi:MULTISPECIES: hypothetical protein [Psychrilyobacter]|nr:MULTISPECIES: hypothetical protein [Psychrilyobacter]MCS5421362.1 hypothetical protein [Psychrilyobacter sp. S5]NDI77491.1 hypothetical protein [Psychrilyobacter piezotolerans]
MFDITFKPIGYISSPFKRVEEIPAQSIHAKEKVATIKLMEEYRKIGGLL